MLKRLIALANKLDAMGRHDIAGELDEICREAAKWIDKRPESERGRDPTSEWEAEEVPRVEKELMPRPGESDPRRWLIDEKGTHEEDRSEPTPEERLKKIFPGKQEDIDPDELSEENLEEDFKTERSDETFSPDLDLDKDKLVELMEGAQQRNEMDADGPHEEGCDCEDCNDAQNALDILWS